MNSISALTGQPRVLTVNGQTYQIHPLTLDDLGQLQGWVDSHFPDPFQAVNQAIAKGNYNVTQQQYLFKLATEQAVRPRNLIGTPEADRLLMSIEGIKRMLVLSIRKGRPDFSDADADELYRHLGLGDVQAAYVATGVGPVMGDPKDGKGKSKRNGSSTSRSSRSNSAVSTGGIFSIS